MIPVTQAHEDEEMVISGAHEDAVLQAEADYNAALDAEEDPDVALQQRRAAELIAYTDFFEDMAESGRKFFASQSTLERIRDVAISDSERLLERAKAEVESWQAEQQALRNHAYAIAVADAAEIRDNRIALAEHDRSDSHADA